MKVTISIPAEIFKKLERDRGVVPRSTYIQELVKGSGGGFSDKPELVDPGVEGGCVGLGEGIKEHATEHFKSTENPILKKGSFTKSKLEGLQEVVEEAKELGDGENWERVRGMLDKAGYEWDGRQNAILEGGRVIYRAKGR